MAKTVQRQQGSQPLVEFDDVAGGHRIVVTNDSSGATAGQVQGNVADAATDAGNPVKVGAVAQDPDALPAAVAAGKRVNLLTDLSRRLIVWVANQLDPTNDGARSYEDASVVRPTITTSAAAYTAGDNIGGIIDLGALAQASGAPLALRSIVLKDDINQKPDLQLLFFRSSPAGTYTDNAAVVVSTADMGALVYCQKVAAADWVTIQGITKAVVSYSLDNGPLLGPAASNLYLVIVAGATAPDYTAVATDLTAELGFVKAV